MLLELRANAGGEKIYNFYKFSDVQLAFVTSSAGQATTAEKSQSSARPSIRSMSRIAALSDTPRRPRSSPIATA
jgi:hypothetical protein